MNTRSVSGQLNLEMLAQGASSEARAQFFEFRKALVTGSRTPDAVGSGITDAVAYFEPDFYGPGLHSVEAVVKARGESLDAIEQVGHRLIATALRSVGVRLVSELDSSDPTSSDSPEIPDKDSATYEASASYLVPA